MITNNSDKEWERLGKLQPYYGVLTDKAYYSENLNEDALKRFFGTGEEYVSMIFDQIRSRLHPEFKPGKALDFGCGVGRLVVPLASRCAQVTGVDISVSMRKEAEENCRKRNLANVSFASNLEEIDPAARFDFINSFIVLQHIPARKGLRIFRSMLAKLAPGGSGAVHLTYRQGSSPFKAAFSALRKSFNPINYLVNMAKGRPIRTPYMQMNSYDMNAVDWALQEAGCTDLISLFTDHEGVSGQILLFRKPPLNVG